MKAALSRAIGSAEPESLAGYSQPHAGQEDRADLGRIRGIAQEQGKPIVMVSIKTGQRTAGPIPTLPFGRPGQGGTVRTLLVLRSRTSAGRMAASHDRQTHSALSN